MASRKDIIRLPDERLRQPSRKVGSISRKVKQLIKDMQDATLDWEKHRSHEIGVALAAIQLGEGYRVLIIRNNLDDKTDKSFQVFINPKITKCEGEIVKDFEGCLSVADIYGQVPRYSKVRVRALNADGQEVSLKAEGFLARVLQHEIDHMRGKLFIDHIKGAKDAFFSLDKDGKLTPIDYDKQKIADLLW